MRNKCIALALSLAVLGIFCGQAPASLSEDNFLPCMLKTVGSQAGQIYHISRGDTLWDISRVYNVDLHTLMAVNHITANTTLKIGQELVLPTGGVRLHCIKAGESMWEIAASYSISLQELKQLNPGQNPGNLKIGATLRLPDKAVYRVAQAQPSRSLAVSAALLSWPVVGMITSRFGWRSSGFHHGLDIAAETGTPITACAGGKVASVGYRAVYGRTVVIDQYDGLESLYAHTQKIYVKPGQNVAKGQVIATVGNTGRTTGPHLHLEIRQNGKTLDPAKYLKR